MRSLRSRSENFAIEDCVRFYLVLFLMVLTLCFLPLSRHSTPTCSAKPNSPFDSYGNICWQDEQARLDNFAIQLHNNPTLTGYIIVYAGRISCRDETKYRGNRARNYVLRRGVDPKRVFFRDAGFQPDIQHVLWLQPKNLPEYKARPSLSKDTVSIKRCVDKMFERVLCPNYR
jgi:hypothetical protein